MLYSWSIYVNPLMDAMERAPLHKTALIGTIFLVLGLAVAGLTTAQAGAIVSVLCLWYRWNHRTPDCRTYRGCYWQLHHGIHHHRRKLYCWSSDVHHLQETCVQGLISPSIT